MKEKKKNSLYKYLQKDIKDFNKYILSLVCIGILVGAGLLSYYVTSSYALFSDTIMGTKTIEGTVKLKNLDTSGANEPVLDDAMIPVYYDSENDIWRKADENNSNKNYKWYDYDSKMWANSVTVSSTNRSKYLSADKGTEISMDDILTMQVWIPRYKYKVWNYNADGTVSSSEQQIEITFEKGTSKTGDITCQDTISGTDGSPSETCKVSNNTCTDSTCNNKTYTHPAFTFGDKEITGFWIGKFELTGTISNITVKPNLSSLRSQTVSSFETNIMNMKNSGNQYGLSTSTDTHMIKNSEWGAVAYIAHSKYGLCTNGTCNEIGINNNSNYTTGCGAVAGSSDSATCNVYNTENGMLSSTTKNVYGIYDMSGSAWEYTMANMISPDGKTMMSGSSSSFNSGYTGKISNSSGNYVSYTGIDYPSSEYYDEYSYNENFDSIKLSKLGDGIKEVFVKRSYGWYDDFLSVLGSGYSWFSRGGLYYDSDGAGLYYSIGSMGSAGDDISSRLIITP